MKILIFEFYEFYESRNHINGKFKFDLKLTF